MEKFEKQESKYITGMMATLFNIMHYAVHDGPGIRTAVFFKGCPLSCKWCHNPEGLSSAPQKIFNEKKCIKCGWCRKEKEFITTEDTELHGVIKKEREEFLTTKNTKKHEGILKGKESESTLYNSVNSVNSVRNSSCPTGARETIGYEITLPQLMFEIKKDLPFYGQSGGGVTFSGGEPLHQAEFLLEVLNQCKEECINTAIDTSGYCDTGILLKAAELCNFIMYDVKFINNEKHKQYCGAPNELILKNLKLLSEIKTKLLIRIPVIPGINDDLGEMSCIFGFLEGFSNIAAIHLLPYHNIHADKYKRLGMEYELAAIPRGQSPNISEIQELFAVKFKTKIGG